MCAMPFSRVKVPTLGRTLPPSAGGQRPPVGGGGLVPALDVELAEQVVDVVLDRVPGDRQPPGDLLVTPPQLDQGQDFDFAGREGVPVGAARVGRLREGGPAAE